MQQSNILKRFYLRVREREREGGKREREGGQRERAQASTQSGWERGREREKQAPS